MVRSLRGVRVIDLRGVRVIDRRPQRRRSDAGRVRRAAGGGAGGGPDGDGGGQGAGELRLAVELNRSRYTPGDGRRSGAESDACFDSWEQRRCPNPPASVTL